MLEKLVHAKLLRKQQVVGEHIGAAKTVLKVDGGTRDVVDDVGGQRRFAGLGLTRIAAKVCELVTRHEKHTETIFLYKPFTFTFYFYK